MCIRDSSILSPFPLYRGTKQPSSQSCGTSPLLQHMLYNLYSHSSTPLPPFCNISILTPSRPADFPFFPLFTALIISSICISSSPSLPTFLLYTSPSPR